MFSWIWSTLGHRSVWFDVLWVFLAYSWHSNLFIRRKMSPFFTRLELNCWCVLGCRWTAFCLYLFYLWRWPLFCCGLSRNATWQTIRTFPYCPTWSSATTSDKLRCCRWRTTALFVLPFSCFPSGTRGVSLILFPLRSLISNRTTPLCYLSSLALTTNCLPSKLSARIIRSTIRLNCTCRRPSICLSCTIGWNASREVSSFCLMIEGCYLSAGRDARELPCWRDGVWLGRIRRCGLWSADRKGEG